MNENPPNLPQTLWRNYSVKSPIGACVLNYEDVKRLFDIIEEKQQEQAQIIIAQLAKQQNEDDNQFVERRTRVIRSLVTTISMTGPNGETVMGNTRSLLDSAAVPERIVQIYFDTSTAPTALLKITPNNRASLLLDFSRPSLVTFGVTPSAPTPNNSNYSIFGDSEPWVTSLAARVREFFIERKTNIGWFHKSGCYDILLVFIGVPAALWGCYRLGSLLPTAKLPAILITSVYVYLFFLVLNIFRILFSYTRWVFPLVELHNPQASWPQRHRKFWLTTIGGLVCAF